MSKNIEIDSSELEAFRQTLPDYRKNENYTLMGITWDVIRAMFLCSKKKRKLENVPVKDVVEGLSIYDSSEEDENTNEPAKEGWQPVNIKLGSPVNGKFALSDSCNLERPLLVAQFKLPSGKISPIVIDGMHRLWKAYKNGLKTLPCYVLTISESNACLK